MIVAVLVTWAGGPAVTLIVMVTDAPEFMLPTVQVTVTPERVQVAPPVAVYELYVTPVGNVSVTTTPVALEDPPLVAVRV